MSSTDSGAGLGVGAGTKPGSRESLLDVLGWLAAAAGVPVDPEQVRRSARAARSEQPGRREGEVLEAAASAMGLKLIPQLRSIRELFERDPTSRAALAVEGPSGWVVVLGRRGRQLRLAEPGGDVSEGRWCSADEVARELGIVDLNQPVAWLAAAPAAPLESIAGSHDGPHGPTPIARLFRLLVLDRDDIGVVLVYAFAVGVLSLATPIAVQSLVNTVAFGSLLQPVVVLTLMVLAVLGLAAALRGLQVRVVEALQQRLFVRVAADLAHRLPRLRASALDGEYGPELVNRFFDVLTVQKAAATFLLDGLGLLLQTTIGLVVLAFYHPALLAYDALLIAVVLVILFLFGRGAPSTAIDESKAKYAVVAWLEELARHPYVFRATRSAELAAERAEVLTRRYLGARRAHFAIVLRQVVGLLWLQAIASAGLLGLGGALVVTRQLTLGQLVAAELIVSAVVASLVKLGKHIEAFYDLVAAVDKLGHLTDLQLEETTGASVAAGDPRGAEVLVTDASFSYADGASTIEGVSLKLEAGARAFVSGTSGSGKTTLAELLFGLRVPTGGAIAIDEVDTRQAILVGLRDRAAFVGAAAEIIDGTVADNVSAGRVEVGPREIAEALRAVGLDEVVRRLPQGTATRLVPSGAPLSSGQARRLAFARAIAARPRLLVVDDALAGLDARSRGVVEAAIFDPEAPWTVVAFGAPDDPLRRRPGLAHVLDLDGEIVSVREEARS
jgi:putative ABC transport system ATP-binding protein